MEDDVEGGPKEPTVSAEILRRPMGEANRERVRMRDEARSEATSGRLLVIWIGGVCEGEELNIPDSQYAVASLRLTLPLLTILNTSLLISLSNGVSNLYSHS